MNGGLLAQLLCLLEKDLWGLGCGVVTGSILEVRLAAQLMSNGL